MIKAREVYRITGEAAIADDSGLEVDALKGQPGVRSRYSEKKELKRTKNNEKLKKAMKDVRMMPEEQGSVLLLLRYFHKVKR